jgi:secondary thiamine-phosphate synthase enzyme
MVEIVLSTRCKSEFVDITARVQWEVAQLPIREGICFLTCPHTTAGIIINEQADPAVAQDIRTFLETLVSKQGPWTHAEGNAPAHVKAALVGNSVQLVFADGKLLLGTWQGIFFCEFDGPRERKIWLHIVS